MNYLYLPTENEAQKAAEELRTFGYRVDVKPAATGSNWLALATKDMVPSRENIDEQRRRFESIARRLGGDYDGWEAAVTS